MGLIVGIIAVIIILRIVVGYTEGQKRRERIKNMPPPKRDALGNICDSRYDLPDVPYGPPKSKYRPPSNNW
jgi:hypothetical protein